MKEVIKESIEKIIEKEKPGLWANIRAKRARFGKKGMSKVTSVTYIVNGEVRTCQSK